MMKSVHVDTLASSWRIVGSLWREHFHCYICRLSLASSIRLPWIILWIFSTLFVESCFYWNRGKRAATIAGESSFSSLMEGRIILFLLCRFTFSPTLGWLIGNASIYLSQESPWLLMTRSAGINEKSCLNSWKSASLTFPKNIHVLQ